MARIFITGATGFAGSHLVDELLAAGHEVVALVHGATSHQPIAAQAYLKTIDGDLLNLAQVKEIVVEARPDIIYHLAGQASPGLSWKNPALTLAVNSGGTANVLEAAVAYGRPRVLVVTSAEIYGPLRPDALPITEASPPRPHHPYGVSKLAAGLLVDLYWQRYQLPVVEARPFNHIGPRQAAGFVVPDFAGQLAAVKLGRQPPTISVGNLSAERDFTDVRDVTRAYRLLAERGRPGETYLICSGQPISIHYLLTALIKIAGVEVDIRYDPARMRPSDTPQLYGSFDKIWQETGWRPEIDLRQSLADAFADWLSK